jgi:GNAT superfamily N-acetyltransferase
VEIVVREATPDDVGTVRDILREAAGWLRQSGRELWREEELGSEAVASDIGAGIVFLAEHAGEAVGTLQLQLTDDLTWPDIEPGDSTFVHRLAVRRQYGGGELSAAMMEWAVSRTVSLGRRSVRLDCDHSRVKLRAVYERFGFSLHSDRQVGPFHVARYEYHVPAAPPAADQYRQDLPPHAV